MGFVSLLMNGVFYLLFKGVILLKNLSFRSVSLSGCFVMTEVNKNLYNKHITL